MWKKIAVLMAAAVFLCGISINVSAAEGGESGIERRGTEISIMMVNISRQYNMLTINPSTGIATIQCKVIGKENVTKTSITATLQKKVGNSWTNVKTWTAASSSNKTSLVKTKSVATGSSYRVKAVFKAYKGKGCESKTTYSAVKKG